MNKLKKMLASKNMLQAVIWIVVVGSLIRLMVSRVMNQNLSDENRNFLTEQTFGNGNVTLFPVDCAAVLSLALEKEKGAAVSVDRGGTSPSVCF